MAIVKTPSASGYQAIETMDPRQLESPPVISDWEKDKPEELSPREKVSRQLHNLSEDLAAEETRAENTAWPRDLDSLACGPSEPWGWPWCVCGGGEPLEALVCMGGPDFLSSQGEPIE